MDASVIRFYPAAATLPLKGLYFEHRLREIGTPQRPFVYSNFVASLDGRISQIDPTTKQRAPPRAITHEHDWGLYLELAAQADAVITSGRRLRQLCQQNAQTVQCVQETAEGELADWRRAHRLALHPVCIVLTATLEELPIDALRTRTHGEIIVMAATTTPVATHTLEHEGIEVIDVGHAAVSGHDILHLARQRGFRTLYSIGGPEILNTLVADGLLDRLYLSTALRLLGGKDFDTFLRGEWLRTPLDLTLHELYFDPARADKPSYLFASFDNAARRPGG
jgi:riboflavin biosynthesis pyrimidine reductase